jgi:hypothetical protein
MPRHADRDRTQNLLPDREGRRGIADGDNCSAIDAGLSVVKTDCRRDLSGRPVQPRYQTPRHRTVGGFRLRRRIVLAGLKLLAFAWALGGITGCTTVIVQVPGNGTVPTPEVRNVGPMNPLAARAEALTQIQHSTPQPDPTKETAKPPDVPSQKGIGSFFGWGGAARDSESKSRKLPESNPENASQTVATPPANERPQMLPDPSPAVTPSPAEKPPELLPLPDAGPGPTGPVRIDGVPLPFGALSHLVDESAPGSKPVGGCESCGDGRQCAPGQSKCESLPNTSHINRIIGAIYETVACPDPCYQPKWIPLANAAFFVDGARPVTQTRLRVDSIERLQFPDRNEFFWARGDGMGKGPRARGAFRSIPSLDYREASQETEVARGAFAFTVTTPYRSLDPDFGARAAGFSDMTLGTKTLLVDSELFLLALQFRTTIPSGNFTKGLGTAHVSLEPSLIAGLRLSQDSYLQSQLSEWIPLGGDPDYMAPILHYHASYNHVLWRPIPDIQLIGTLESNGYTFQDGAFTDPVIGALQKSSGTTILQGGPGVRLFVSDKIDFGLANAFSLTGKYMARNQLRAEFRFRY